MGLNSNDHFENELDTLNNVYFFHPLENMYEPLDHGMLFSGLAEFGDIFYLASSYKLSGDKLIDIVLDDELNWELFCPAKYSYRHATELYMKAIIGNNK